MHFFDAPLWKKTCAKYNHQSYCFNFFYVSMNRWIEVWNYGFIITSASDRVKNAQNEKIKSKPKKNTRQLQLCWCIELAQAQRNDVEWRWTTWRKLNSNNYWASHAPWWREICVQHCYYVLRKKTGNFCYYYIVCYSVVVMCARTHTYIYTYLSIYRQQKCGNENIFFWKISKENSYSKNKLFRHKVHIDVCILETAAIKMNAKMANACIMIAWNQKFEYHLNWVGYWNFMCARECVRACGCGLSFLVGGPDFVVWRTTMTWKFPSFGH